jgi:hypothetical protein
MCHLNLRKSANTALLANACVSALRAFYSVAQRER